VDEQHGRRQSQGFARRRLLGTLEMTVLFSPRAFLRSREALLVHFSTVMTAHADLVFPDDLLNAMTLEGEPLSFSTIQRGDTNPHRQGRGGAEGSIGLLVDVGPATVIHSVSADDSGSSRLGSLGLAPTAENCAASIDKRITSNEWYVENCVPAGLFSLSPIYVRKIMNIDGDPVPSEIELTLADAIAPFPGKRVFTANISEFLELDRASSQWHAVDYDTIILP
jgi:hypothetical protein